MPDLLAMCRLLLFQCLACRIAIAKPACLLMLARPTAVQYICHVGAVAGAVEQGHIAVAIPRLCLPARTAPCPWLQRAVLAMAFAAGAQAPLQQGQACAQAVACNHLVAIGGATVAPRQHAVGAGKPLPWRQVALVGAYGPQGQVLATGIERKNDASFAMVVSRVSSIRQVARNA